MTEGVHYKIDFTTFARLFGFSKDDRDADIIHFEPHMNHSKIASAYEFDELADGSTTALKLVYYVLNMFRETIYPKGRSDSTNLRRFAPNLIARLLSEAKLFSVSKFIWFNLVEVTESGKCNLPYAPYIMYMIEMVPGISFKKDVEHASYQVKHWQHQKKQKVVEEHILKKASSEQHKDEEGPSMGPMPTGLYKLRGMVRDTWRFCNWTTTQLFELREDMNKLLKHQGLSFNAMLPPPPIFPNFPDYTTNEDEVEKDPVSPMAGRNVPAAQSEEEEDIEPLSAKMARLRREAARKRAMGSSSAGRARRKATAGRPVKRPVDISSGSDSVFGSDSTVPEAEEEASDFSDEE
jgi:hypothetical protein